MNYPRESRPCADKPTHPDIPVVDAPPPDAPLVLTAAEVAARLTVSRRTLERLIASGEFPAPLKIGRSSRFHPADLAAFLEKLRLRRGGKVGES